MIYRWDLCWPDGIHEFVKFLVPSVSMMMLCSKQIHLTSLSSYYRSFILLYLTVAILPAIENTFFT